VSPGWISEERRRLSSPLLRQLPGEYPGRTSAHRGVSQSVLKETAMNLAMNLEKSAFLSPPSAIREDRLELTYGQLNEQTNRGNRPDPDGAEAWRICCPFRSEFERLDYPLLGIIKAVGCCHAFRALTGENLRIWSSTQSSFRVRRSTKTGNPGSLKAMCSRKDHLSRGTSI